MTITDIQKMMASMNEFGYSRREISYALDIPMKDVKRILQVVHV